jgi:autotransporter-associated beta strand protein
MNRVLLSQFLLVAVATLSLARPASAQTSYTWNGTSGPLWSSIPNWNSSPSTGTAPPSDFSATGTLVILGGTTGLTNTLDYNLSVNSLTFAAAAGSFTVGNSGSSALTIGSGGITVSSTNSQTLNVPISLATDQVWTNSGGSSTTLQIGGTISTGGSNLTLTGVGNFNILQPITGGGTLTKSGTGVTTLYQANTNSALTVSAGTLVVTPNGSANPLGTGLVTLGGGTLAFRQSIAMTPVSLTAASFNQDVIASVSEQSLPAAASGTQGPGLGTTTSVDGSNFVFFERGRTGAPNPTTDGLPSGGFLTAVSNPQQTFQLQAYGTAAASNNNALQVTGTNSGTISLTTPASFSQIAIANTTGGGPTTFNVVLNFADSTTTTYSGITGQNWFGGTNAVISGLDRLNNQTAAYGSNGNDPQIYSTFLTLSAADQAKLLSSVTFNKTNATGILNIFALSGGTVTGYTGSQTTLSYPNAVSVTAASTLDLGYFTSTSIGGLTLGANLTLAVGLNQTGATFNPGNITLTAPSTLTVPTGLTVSAGTISGAFAFTKAGAGQINLSKDSTNAGYTMTAGTTVVIPESASAKPLGTGLVTLSGGTIAFRGPLVTPVTLTAASFNQDVVASVAEQGLASPYGTTNSVDGANFVYYEKGRTGSIASGGLPSNGTLVSVSNSNQTFQLQGYGTAAARNNNVMQVTGTNSGTITLATPASFSQIVIANATGSGPTTYDAVLNFSSGSPTTYSNITGQNWFGGTNAIIAGLDRLNTSTGNYDNNTSNPQIYATSFSLSPADTARTLTSITFNKTNGTGILNIFALSGGLGLTTQSFPTTNFAVTANSTLDITDITSLTLGNLSFTSNSSLTFTTSSGTAAVPTLFTAGTVTLGANATLNYPNSITFTLGQFSDGGTARTFTKSGSGVFTVAASGGTTTPLNLTTGTTFAVSNGTVNLNAANSITAGALNFNVTGGTTNLTVANAATSGQTVFTQSGGTVNANAATVFGAPSTTVNGNGGTWNIAAGNNYSIGSLASTTGTAAAQTINLNGTTLTINGSDGVTPANPFRGRIQDGSAAGAVVVSGGTTTFSAANPFTGGLTISGGKVTALMPGTIGSGPIILGNGTLSLAGIPSVGAVSGFGTGFTANGGAVINANGSATITTAGTNQARSVFSSQRIPVDSDFTVNLRYSQSNTSDPANGVTITIQGAAGAAGNGSTVVGGNGTGFGYTGISPAFTMAMNAQTVNGGFEPGVAPAANGAAISAFFPGPSPGFPNPLNAQAGSGFEWYLQLTYHAATKNFTGFWSQQTPAQPGTIIYYPLSTTQTDPAPTFAGFSTTMSGGNLNPSIPDASLAYNLLANIGGGAYIGVTGSTNGTASQTTQQVIDQFAITSTAASTNYNQPVTISAGTSATINILSKTGVTDFFAGALTIGSGATGLTLAPETGSVANGNYTLTFGATTLNGNPTFTVNNNGTGVGTLFLGALADGGTARTITKAGPGVLILGTPAASLVAGTQVNVTAGTLTVTNATALGTNAQLTVGGIVNFNAASTIASLTGGGNVNLGGNALTVGNAQNLSSTFSGVIAGTGGSLVKAGTGTLTLTGANTYTGPTTVSAGTLAVNNTTGTGTGTGLTTVAAGATVMGSGTIGGSVTINGTLSPGNSIGTLNANAGETQWASGGKYTVEYTPGSSFTPGTTIDYFNSLGTLNVTATQAAPFTINLVRLAGGTTPATTSATIATFTGTSGTGFAANRFAFTGDFAGAVPMISLDASNNVVLSFTPVPEPVTVLGLSAGGLALAGWARRRARRTV